MPKFKDLTGLKYGRLTVLELDKERTTAKRKYWLCECECGNVTSTRSDQLGKCTFSCGCYAKELAEKNLVGRHTTGEQRTRLAGIWYKMRTRCNNPKQIEYHHYGGRGIRVCKEWEEDFLKFKEWAVNNGYDDTLTIDRIDVNGDYEPSNCRWQTIQQQLNNKRTTLWVECNGEWMSLMQAYQLFEPDITYQTAKTRYHQGERDPYKLFENRKHRGNQ